MKRSTQGQVIAVLLISAPAANAIADYLSGEMSLRTAIGATISGCMAAAITYFMNPPRVERAKEAAR